MLLKGPVYQSNFGNTNNCNPKATHYFFLVFLDNPDSYNGLLNYYSDHALSCCYWYSYDQLLDSYVLFMLHDLLRLSTKNLLQDLTDKLNLLLENKSVFIRNVSGFTCMLFPCRHTT